MVNSVIDPDQEEDTLGRGYTGYGRSLAADDTRPGTTDMSSFENSLTPKNTAAGSKKPPNSLNPSALKNAEQGVSGSAGQSSAKLTKEGLGEQAFYSGKALGAAQASGPLGGIGRARAIFQSRRGQAAGITGLAVTLLFIIFGIFTSSLVLQNVKESWRTNKLGSLRFSASRRRTKVLFGVAKGLSTKSVETVYGDLSKLDPERFASNLEKAGFTVGKSESGVIESIASKDGKVLVDYTSKTLGAEEQLAKSLAGRSGKKIAKQLAEVYDSEAAIVRGEGGQKVLSMLKTRFGSIGESLRKSDPNKSTTEQATDIVNDAEQPQEPEIRESGGASTADELANENPTNDPATGKQAVDEVGNPIKSSATDLTQIGETAAEDSLKTQEALAARSSGILERIFGTEGGNVLGIFEKLGANFAEIGLKGALTAGLTAVNPVLLANQVCQVKGYVQYISAVRNIRLAIELSRFAVKFLGTADAQRAGVVSGEALHLFMSGQLNVGGAQGSWVNSGGLSAITNPGGGNRATKAGLSNYTTGHSNGGIFQDISSLIESIPLSGALATGCSIVGNGWVQFGTFVVGGLAAIFSGGGSVEATTSAGFPIYSVGAQVLLLLATEIGGPLLAKTGKHLVMSYAKGVMGGEAISSGLGALASQQGSSSVAILTPKPVTALLEQAAKQDRKEAMKKASFKERYFSTTNSDSLLMRTAAIMPLGLPGFTLTATKNITIGLAGITTGNYMSNLLGNGSAYADGSACSDPQIVKYNIQTDDFCNPTVAVMPDLNLEQTRQLLLDNKEIDSSGQLIGDGIKAFKSDCTGDSPALLWDASPEKDGSTENSEITTCVDDSVALNGETRGALGAYAYLMPDKSQKQSWYAKVFGTQKAYAAEAETNLSRLVSARENYAAYLGAQQDVHNIIDETNGFANTVASPAQNTPTSSPISGNYPVAGTPISGQNTSSLQCPVSPTIKDEGINPLGQAYLDGKAYDIRMCAAHGVHLNAIIAKSFDDLFTSMISAGYSIRGSFGFRTMSEQIAGYNGGKGADTFAKPGYSNHQFGTAVDISCSNADGTAKYIAGTGRYQAAFLAGVSAYPCLNYIHQNSANYGLLLSCDGVGSGGGEIRANSGGCEWWHLSTTGK